MDYENFSKEDLIEALRRFNKPKETSKEELKSIHTFLNKVEKSKLIWIRSIEILNQENLETTTYFFAAKFLKSKLQFDFVQVSSNDYNHLLQAIIKGFQYKDRAIKIELCIAFTYLYMHIYEIFGDLIQFLQKNLPSLNIDINPLSLESMEIIECIGDKSLYENKVIEDELKEKYFIYLEENLQKNIIILLNQCTLKLNNNDEGQRYLYWVLKCFANWISFTKNREIISHLHELPIFKLIFTSLNTPELLEKGSNCIISIIDQIYEIEEYQELFNIIYGQILLMFNDLENFIKNDMSEEEKEFTYIIYFFAKRFMKELIRKGECDENSFFGKMLKISSLDEYTAFNQIVRCWRKMFSKINKEKNHELKRNLIIKFNDYYIPLINIIVKNMVFSIEQLISFDDRSKKKKHRNSDDDDYADDLSEKLELREELYDLLSVLSQLIGFDKIIVILANNIKQELPNLVPGKKVLSNWAKLEANLFAIKSIVSKANKTNSHYLTEIYFLILGLPLDLIEVKKTCVEIIKESASLIESNTELILQIFDFLARQIPEELIRRSVYKALGTLCANNSNILLQKIVEFLALYNQICQDNHIVEGFTKAISLCPDKTLFYQYLKEICKPFTSDLFALYKKYEELEKEQEMLSKEEINRICNDLDKLSLIARNMPIEEQNIESSNPLKEIYKEFWPFIQLLCDKFANEPEIIEKVCRFIKHTMRCLKLSFSEFILPLFELVHKQYEKNTHSSYLYIIEVSVTVYGQYQEYTQILQVIYEFMCQRTLKELPKLGNFEENPYLTEDFFGLLSRFLKYAPKIWMMSSTLHIALQLAEIGIGIQHIEAGKSVYQFLENLFGLCNNNVPEYDINLDGLRNIIIQENFGERYIYKLVEVIKMVPTNIIRKYVYDIFIVALHSFNSLAINWFRDAFKQLTNDILTEKEKNNILTKFTDPNCDFDSQFEMIGNRCKQSSLRDVQD